MSTTIAVNWKAAGYGGWMYVWLLFDRRSRTSVRQVATISGVQNVVVVLGLTDLFLNVLPTDDDNAVPAARTAHCPASLGSPWRRRTSSIATTCTAPT